MSTPRAPHPRTHRPIAGPARLVARLMAPVFVAAGLWGFFRAHPLTGALPHPFLNVSYLLWGSISLYVGYAYLPDRVPSAYAHGLGVFFLLLGALGLGGRNPFPAPGMEALDLAHAALGATALGAGVLAVLLSQAAREADGAGRSLHDHGGRPPA